VAYRVFGPTKWPLLKRRKCLEGPKTGQETAPIFFLEFSKFTLENAYRDVVGNCYVFVVKGFGHQHLFSKRHFIIYDTGRASEMPALNN
jgi:hypothetical protein